MRQKAIEIKKMQAMERIEAKLDFMLRLGEINPETLQPFTREEKEKEIEAGSDKALEAGSELEVGNAAEITPETPTEPPAGLEVKPEDQAIATPVAEPPAETLVESAQTEEKPKSRKNNK